MNWTKTHAKCKSIRNRLYPIKEWPGVIYEKNIVKASGPEKVLLEVGCGRDGRQVEKLASKYKYAIGVDWEIARQRTGSGNWFLSCADAHCIPLRSRSVDTITMAHVTEHLSDPAKALKECSRVLRPGGVLIILTVNKWFPPILLGRMLPHRLRQSFNLFAEGRVEEDTFPAYYRANSRRALERAGSDAGLRVQSVQYLSHHPRYFMFSVVVYRLAVMVERLVRKYRVLRGIRQFLEVTYVRPSEQETDA